MSLLSDFRPAPADFPNHLALPQPERRELPSARWLLVLLVALCIVPRAITALRIPSVCPDGVLYIRLAQAIEAGDLRTGFQEMSLNIYPVILAGLHRLGLEWDTAAAIWGVAISSLVLLPLWGWARRQFDDRVALIACLLYVVHPKMIEWSPEVIRDPTFWFLFMLAIYCLWRAVTEVRHGYFVAGGAAITLAALTRVEGLFLLIPLVLWTFWRVLALRTGRRRLLLGATLCAAAFPALLLLVNAVWLSSRHGGALVRLDPLARVQPWLQFILGRSAVDVESLDPPLGVGRMIRVFIPTMTRGLAPVFALLMFGGMWGWRRVWSRRDHQALFCVGMVIACGIWVQLWSDKYICPRYALSIVLMGTVFAALGMLGLMGRLVRITAWLGWGRRGQLAVLAATATIAVSLSLGAAMTSNTKDYELRQMSANIGAWLRREFPEPPMLVGPMGVTPVVSYYAHSSPYQAFRWEADDASILRLAEQSKAGVVLLRPTKQMTDQRCDDLVDRLKTLGLEPVAPEALPISISEMRVLVRSKASPHVAQGAGHPL